VIPLGLIFVLAVGVVAVSVQTVNKYCGNSYKNSRYFMPVMALLKYRTGAHFSAGVYLTMSQNI